MPNDELLKDWLNDAYSMEKSLIPVLENHANDAKDHPDIRQRDLQHAEETRRHVELVEQCLESLGEKPSTVKSMWGSVMGKVQSVATGPFKDEMMKNFISDYATEQLEIASYKALIAAARASGHERIAQTCQQILSDEERMADWLDQNIGRAAEQTLAAHAR